MSQTLAEVAILATIAASPAPMTTHEITQTRPPAYSVDTLRILSRLRTSGLLDWAVLGGSVMWWAR